MDGIREERGISSPSIFLSKSHLLIVERGKSRNHFEKVEVIHEKVKLELNFFMWSVNSYLDACTLHRYLYDKV